MKLSIITIHRNNAVGLRKTIKNVVPQTFTDFEYIIIDWFLRKAKLERGLALDANTSKEKLLTHLNLYNQGKLSNAAILLFGVQPQRFFITSEVKCAHFHGVNVEKPIPYYQVYKGNLFDLVDQAVNFVLSKIDYAVGTRSQSAVAPTAYEIPPAAIEEAIVNAIAHRDYDSMASVQVMLFADRLEIRNPGQLPPALTFEALKKDHSSYPRNPLIAESMYLTKYIERMGTGIQDIIKHCVEYGLPEPEFKMTDTFVTTIYRKKGIAFEKVGGHVVGQTITEGQNDIEIRHEKGAKRARKGHEKGEKIIQLINDNPSISINDLARMLGVSVKSIRTLIDKLKKSGEIN
ncbi:MAG: winged helix-turn-helix transcriptional regulator, partial [Bacteroidales bacterium]|nr:winged helix-turn-helix transcriptional regulator [Bacteroidales bacterium]